jgi:NADH:ubiquinone oxidoreductase subunit 2 (subunit N)
VVRAIYWSKPLPDRTIIHVSTATRISLYACIAGMFYLGLFPNQLVNIASEAVKTLRL